jgi:phosphoribosyl 1,2-cyclic phosphodiesterase
MRFASLGSGSRGNALVVQHQSTTVLVDCGFSTREVKRRLSNLNLDIDTLDAVVVTHEHKDHISGVGNLARKYRLPVYATSGTGRAACWGEIPCRYEVMPDHPLAIGELEFVPFTVPHDAAQPCQFVVSDGDRRLGVLTDTGSITPHIISQLTYCQAMVLECNHDTQMLLNGDYPHYLKMRITGQYGHLSNQQAAELLRSVDTSRLKHLVAAHLSEKNNTCELARAEISGALDCEPQWIDIIDQYDGLQWRDL